MARRRPIGPFIAHDAISAAQRRATEQVYGECGTHPFLSPALRKRKLAGVDEAIDARPVPLVLWVFDVLGMPQTVVAKAAGVTPPALNQWRQGKRPIPRQRRVELLAHLMYMHMAARDMRDLNPTVSGHVYERARTVAVDGILRLLLTDDVRTDVLIRAGELWAIERPYHEAQLAEMKVEYAKAAAERKAGGTAAPSISLRKARDIVTMLANRITTTLQAEPLTEADAPKRTRRTATRKGKHA